jgi:predicted RNA binding protein YcfA (HicA-like mRNA interferase family)
MTLVNRGLYPELKKLLAELYAEGWSSEITNGGHVKIKHSDYGFVICASTTRDRRSIQNVRGDIRRQKRAVAMNNSPRKVGVNDKPL